MRDYESELAEREKRFLDTVKKVRGKFFALGKPYLMLSEDLPEGESYWEYPDGKIEIQSVSIAYGKAVITLIRVLSAEEAEKVRGENGL